MSHLNVGKDDDRARWEDQDIQLILNWLKDTKNFEIYKFKKSNAYDSLQKVLGGRFTAKQIENKFTHLVKKYKVAKSLTKKTGWGVDGDSTSINGTFTYYLVFAFHSQVEPSNLIFHRKTSFHLSLLWRAR